VARHALSSLKHVNLPCRIQHLPSESSMRLLKALSLGWVALPVLQAAILGENGADLATEGCPEESSSEMMDERTSMHANDILVRDAPLLARGERIDQFVMQKHRLSTDTWTNCGGSDDLLKLKNWSISPDPPVSGRPLTLAFEGDLKRPIEGSEEVHIQVWYGVIKIVDTTKNLCEELGKVDGVPQCPFQPGHWTFNHTKVLSADIPSGQYTLTMEAYSRKFEAGIFCVSGTFRFGPQRFEWQ
jgi:hypothetical protein